MRRAPWGLLACLAACAPPAFDDTREPADTGSFGTIAYTLICKRLAYLADRADGSGTYDVTGATYRAFCRVGGAAPPNAYPEVVALGAGRARLIGALDTAFPASFLGPLQGLLTANGFLALYDDGTIVGASQTLADLMKAMAGDAEFRAAMAQLDARRGMRPPIPALGALRVVARYPDLDAFLLAVPPAIAPGGAAHDEFQHLVVAASRELADTGTVARRADPERTLNLAIQLLLTESPSFPSARPRWLARRDARGLPVVATIAPPYVDKDGDGLADVNATGSFVDAAGAPIASPTPFPVAGAADAAPRDAFGRAALYRYVDVDRTLLGAVARDAFDLLSPSRGTGLDLLRASAVLLGARRTTTRAYAHAAPLTYRGFDASGAALLDMIYAYLDLLADPGIDDTLGLLRALVADHEHEASRLLEAILATNDLGKQFPGAALEPGSPLYDDLVPVANQILAVPGLAEDVLRALEAPETRDLAARFGELMTYKDRIDFDPSTQATIGSFRTPVDRTATDSGFNRSLFQRILHLIHDSDGHAICNKDGAIIRLFGIPLSLPYNACDLMRIDDLAVFYVQSIAYAKDAQGRVLYDSDGRPLPKALLPLNLPSWMRPLTTDGLLEFSSGIDGFRWHPTPQALNRVLFLDPSPSFIASVLDPPTCADGDRYIDQHPGSLAALELKDTYAPIRPLVQAFADHDAEHLFVAVLSVLHKHWPSRRSLQHQHTNPVGYGYAWQSNVASYEPLIARMIADAKLWPAITESAATVDAIVVNGKNAPAVLASHGRWVFGPRPGLAKRGGATTTTTEDGRPVATLSPWHLLADAYKAKRAALAAAGDEGKLWDRAGGEVLDLLARGDATGGGWRFRNPRFRGMTLLLIDFLRGRVAAHRGTLDDWLHREMPARVEEVMTGPVYAGAADFVLSLSSAPSARAALESLGQHLLSGGEPTDVTLTVAGDLLQWFADDPDLVPLVHMAGKALDPAGGLVDAHLTFLAKARAVDTRTVVATVLSNLFDQPGPGLTADAAIVDAICDVNRTSPVADRGKPLGADDYGRVFDVVGTFLSDEKRGLRRFVDIVEDRHLP
ncbi:MAG TPA: hypothetical protein VKE22_24085 [Haliangiales bacterium]|nr:hypothetical protein [Haliangiales bacterium]